MKVDSESQSIVDYTIAEQEFVSLAPAIFQQLSFTSGSGFKSNYQRSCEPLLFVSGDTSQYSPPAVFSFDLSKADCTMPDSRKRSGKLLITLTNDADKEGALVIVKFRDYLSADVNYACDSMIIAHKGSNQNYYSLTAKVVNGRCFTERYKIYFDCNHTIAAYTRSGPLGEGPQFSYYGSSSGRNRVGLAYNAVIKKDIYKRSDCRYFVKGEVEIIPEGFKPRLVDLGEGDCDDDATFTVNENTVAFKLK